ncbi:HHR138Cp [Eremothecium sinecaudum]|uniref:Transmembrane 9 superfamily member n=1 Tax=Eremothecium sinecaudum TaxID=45286 RepID=A0A109UYN9_9SACH|nr:HHR138Cp [Eremothecium sinecaudum]AMD22907.1 HHR138Cp [Eremothecium sinecaudum]
MLLSIISILVLLRIVNGFYLPGVAPITYHTGDKIPLLVNHLTRTRPHGNPDKKGHSADYKLNYVYSFDYYYEKLHFCKPEKIEKQPESLGSVIFGDRLYNSPFSISMLKDETCVKLCDTKIPGEDAKFVNDLIRNSFFYNMLVDGLPAGRKIHDEKTKTDFYGTGFELGFLDFGDTEPTEKVGPQKRKNVSLKDPIGLRTYLVNHFNIEIEYHDRGNDDYRVVGVTVHPESLSGPERDSCKSIEMLSLDEESENEVTFTYSVSFKPSDVPWATRWGKYLHVYDPKVQWYSLINFSIIVVVLSCMMVHSLFRALHHDLARYNEFNLENEFQEEYGWKLVHSEVFRAPVRPMLLSICVGSGAQLFLMAGCTIFIALLGLLSPSARGSLGTAMFLLYAIFGGLGSYTSMATYKFCGGQLWKVNMLFTPLLVPMFLFTTMIVMNFFLMSVHSSGAIPFGTIVAMFFLWSILSIPISFLGSIIAWKKNKWDEHPTKTNQIARQIPTQPWYLRMWPATFIAGIFPFGSIAVELYFIYSSIWYNMVYYMFGFLFFTFILLTLTTALVTVLLTYYSLCMEDWRWQWRSFIIGGFGCSVYIFIHSILFTKFRLGGFVTIVLYVGYSFTISVISCLVTGSIGYLSSLIFVRKIYSNVKVD